MNRVIEFFIGLLFGWGLLISGMTDPAKVIGFLDLAGTWDPSLAFVMGGAILVGLFGFAAAKKRTQSLLGAAMQLPASRDIDRRLVLARSPLGLAGASPAFAQAPASSRWAPGNPRPRCSCCPWWPVCWCSNF